MLLGMWGFIIYMMIKIWMRLSQKKIKNAYINVVQYLNPLLSLVLLLGNIFMLYKKTIIHPSTVMGNLSRNVLQWFCVPEHWTSFFLI